MRRTAFLAMLLAVAAGALSASGAEAARPTSQPATHPAARPTTRPATRPAALAADVKLAVHRVLTDRPPMSLAGAVATIPGGEFGDWAPGAPGARGPLVLTGVKTFGQDERLNPQIMVVQHACRGWRAQRVRFYGIRGDEYQPLLEIAGADVACQPFNYFNAGGLDFLLVSMAKPGQYDQQRFVIWRNGPTARFVPHENPVLKYAHLAKPEERVYPSRYEILQRREGAGWRLGFRFYILSAEPAPAGRLLATGQVQGWVRLETDQKGEPVRFVCEGGLRFRP